MCDRTTDIESLQHLKEEQKEVISSIPLELNKFVLKENLTPQMTMMIPQ